MSTKEFLIWQSSFHPDSSKESQDEMRETFISQRHSLGLDSLKKCAQITQGLKKNVVSDELINILTPHSEESYAVFDDPIFEIWLSFLHRAAAKGREEEVFLHCVNLTSVLKRVEMRINGKEQRYLLGTKIPIQQNDLDPYLMAATPPSYDFIEALQSEDEISNQGHPVELQTELLGLALKSIGNAWPEMKGQIIEFVKIIGYLPRATFRSCSASRYPGVIYIGNMDESILDIEESMVHEAGHQVLYRLAELTPLTKPNTSQAAEYELPWSGSKRDLFGFFHAFYIYALLAKYFWRRALVGDHNSRDARKRSILILMGMRLAEPMLKSDSNLSEQGRIILDQLCNDMDILEENLLNI